MPVLPVQYPSSSPHSPDPPILDANTARLDGHALLSSGLDYAHSIMYGMSKSLTAKLQHQQNILARVVLRTNHLSSAGQLLSELHWLPVASRIHFKIATRTHKILSTGTSSYLSSLLNHYQLRLSSSNLLVQPPSKTKFGSLAFHTTAPMIWNGLPAVVGSSPSFQTFKKMLKNYYFRSPPPWSCASPVHQIHFGWAHPDSVIITLVCVSNRQYYYYSLLILFYLLLFPNFQIDTYMLHLKSHD